MQVQTKFENDTFKRLQKALKNELSPKQLRKQTYIVLSKVGKGHSVDIAKRVREFLTVKSADAKKQIDFTKPTTGNKQSAKITIKHSSRPPLSAFTHRQTKTGVTYKLDKKKGRRQIKGAFKIQRWDDDVFVRDPDKGQPYRVVRKYGASVWGSYKKNVGVKWSRKQINKRMKTELSRRVQFLLHKQKMKTKKKGK